VRWLTVRVPGDTDTEIYLEKPEPPAYDEATTSELLQPAKVAAKATA